ncbi:transposase [Arthrobacter sp. PL16]|uniref:IS110 family transposase n=1 Tax=Arthrobacter sp. PL16 TaxID=3071720 RepID=UPI002E04C12D|nr:transposase [Arthrobacter sp. PL16]
MTQVWAGIDAGKTHHHCAVIDTDGTRLYSQRVANDESALLNLITDVTGLTDGTGEVVWAVDLNHGRAVSLIALLVAQEQRLLYIPCRTVQHASQTPRGDGKTDAKDAMVIANQARMRRDLQPLRVGDEASVNSRVLISRRAHKAADRGRTINRLPAQLSAYPSALTHAFDGSRFKAALMLLTGGSLYSSGTRRTRRRRRAGHHLAG